MEQLSVLILDDEKRLCDELEEFLKRKNFLVHTATHPSTAFHILEKEQIDIMVLDIKLPEMSGLEVLKKVKNDYNQIEVIMISGHGDMQSVIEAMRTGATDYFQKPFRLADIEHAIHRTERFVTLSRQLQHYDKSISLLTKRLYESSGAPMIGESNVIKEVMRMMEKVARSEQTSVLVTGESGTGKELVAHGIHLLSNRKTRLFHAVNCSAITDSLFESEFFGHKKGSFTGAVDDRAGWFEIANGGTLFLDEIGDMPVGQQAKLLRALEERMISRVGTHQKIAFDVRVIAASNHDLEKMAENKTFRDDLFHRLSTFMINLPPLRQRKDDIPLLINYFLNYFAGRMKIKTPKLSREAVQKILEYNFPGNIRELRNLIERAVILSEDGLITTREIPLNNHSSDSGEVIQLKSFDLEESEKLLIKKALEKCKGNKSQAAQLLNITWQSLSRKLIKYGIK
ncbi:MAG: sigma-54 dependent transcriptional regulator [Bacteroidales bacterium]|jgi:DNA-binding NtrC family response regulator|nr:sigma-54 dependent transcriptional regulator [Bacteroidales bacterium]